MTSGNIECKQMRFYSSTKGLTFRALLNNSAGHTSCSMSDQLFIFIGEWPRDQKYIVRFITVLINSCTSTKPFVSKCRAEYLCFLLIFVIIYSWKENIIQNSVLPWKQIDVEKVAYFQEINLTLCELSWQNKSKYISVHMHILSRVCYASWSHSLLSP